MKETVRMLAAALIAAGLFLALFLLLHWNLIVCILLSVGAYVGLYLLLKPSRKIAGVYLDSLPDGEEIRKMLEEAADDIKTLKESSRKIADPAVRKEAEALFATGSQILRYLMKNPEKLSQARRFFTYYLEMAVKLTNRYIELQATGLHTGEVTGVLRKTAGALPVLNRAFEKQFTHLMQGELLDVEADIGLLNSMLELEDER